MTSTTHTFGTPDALSHGTSVNHIRLAAGAVAPGRDTFDEALIERIATGDAAAAMTVLFTRYNARIYRFVLRLVDDSEAAEELVNEVFIAVWRDAARFKARSQVSTWLLSIARHKALAWRRQRTTVPLDEGTSELIEDTADGPEAAIEWELKGKVLRDCLTKLSLAHREIIDLVYYHEMSISDAAEIIGVGVNTVKTRMFYARKRLMELVTAQGIATASA